MATLDEDRFDALLSRRLSDEQEGEDCNLEAEDEADLALMREALDNYKAETLRFTQQQSSVLPTPRVHKVISLWDSTPRWAVAATAILALGCSSVFVAHRGSQAQTATFATAPDATALAEDNRLLLSVDQALSMSSGPSEEDLGLSATPARHTKLGSITN